MEYKVESGCVISKTADISDRIYIGHNCVIGDNVIIGNNCWIKSGAIIGEIGFGYSLNETKEYIRVPHYGSVTLGDSCYIASSIIKNQVRLGNNVTVGMGSVVTRNFDDNKIIYGSPAKEKGR